MKYNLQQEINPKEKGANKCLILKAKISQVRTSYTMKRPVREGRPHRSREEVHWPYICWYIWECLQCVCCWFNLDPSVLQYTRAKLKTPSLMDVAEPNKKLKFWELASFLLFFYLEKEFLISRSRLETQDSKNDILVLVLKNGNFIQISGERKYTLVWENLTNEQPFLKISVQKQAKHFFLKNSPEIERKQFSFHWALGCSIVGGIGWDAWSEVKRRW